MKSREIDQGLKLKSNKKGKLSFVLELNYDIDIAAKHPINECRGTVEKKLVM